MNKKKIKLNEQGVLKNIKLTIGKVRKSPSPPSHHGNDLLLNQKPQAPKPQLASDFIKNMIKNKDPAKKVGILSGKIGSKLKIRRSPNREEATHVKKEVKLDEQKPHNFTMDMKRLGIMEDIKAGQESKKKLIIKQRHISPPPPNLAEPLIEVGKTGAEEDIESNCSASNKQASKITNFENKGIFKFPFQRRARSLSLPKDKDGNDIEPETQQTTKQLEEPKDIYDSRQKQNQNFGLVKINHKSPSPTSQMPSTNSKTKLNKPIMAKDNFVLAHKNLIPGVNNLFQQQQDAELMMGRQKEVDEWLMGSGESADTAVSKELKGQPSFRIIDSKSKEANIPPRPERGERKEPEEEDQEDEETWMFKTFKKDLPPPASKPVAAAQPPEIKEEADNQKPAPDLDPFGGVDDFMMSKRIEPTYQSHPQEALPTDCGYQDPAFYSQAVENP